MTYNITILSLGQLTQPDVSKTTAAFANILQEEKGYSSWWSSAVVEYVHLMDKIWYHTLDNYNLGNIGTSEFRHNLAVQFGIEETLYIDKAWSAMCKISPVNLNRITIILNSLNEQNQLLVISSTNPLQDQYIQAQINSTGLNHKYINIIKSFEEHVLSLRNLAQVAVSSLAGDDELSHVISIHRDIKSLDVPEGVTFSYITQQEFFKYFDSLNLAGQDSEL
jgi:hypothetical protein